MLRDDYKTVGKPERGYTVAVIDDETGEPAKRKKRLKKDDDRIVVLVTDQNGKLLRSLEWSIVDLERGIEKMKKEKVSDVRIAANLVSIGEDAETMTRVEIMEALRRRGVEV